MQFWLASGPIASTSMGDPSAAVVGSVTTKFSPVAEGDPAVSVIVSRETSKGTTTNGTTFESAPGLPGFCTCSVAVAADSTSAGLSAIEHSVADWHVVLRAVPFSKIWDAPLPLPATKFTPSTLSGNPSTAPAITLDGSTTSIPGPLVNATVAVADLVESAALVAVTAISFGEGAVLGAEKSPVALTVPHAAPPQPSPATPLATLQFTAAFVVPVTCAMNCTVVVFDPDGATNAYPGDIVTATLGGGPMIVTVAFPLFVASAALVAVSITGFVPGTFAGARKSMLPVAAPEGAMHGLDPVTHTSPTDAFPFATPFTLHATASSVVPLTVAEKLAR